MENLYASEGTTTAGQVPGLFASYRFCLQALLKHLHICMAFDWPNLLGTPLDNAVTGPVVASIQDIAKDADKLVLSDIEKFISLGKSLAHLSRLWSCHTFAPLFNLAGNGDYYNLGHTSGKTFFDISKTAARDSCCEDPPLTEVCIIFADIVGYRRILVCCLLGRDMPAESFFRKDWMACVASIMKTAVSDKEASLKEMQRISESIRTDILIREDLRRPQLRVMDGLETLLRSSDLKPNILHNKLIEQCILTRQQICEGMLKSSRKYSPLRLETLIDVTGAWNTKSSFEDCQHRLLAVKERLTHWKETVQKDKSSSGLAVDSTATEVLLEKLLQAANPLGALPLVIDFREWQKQMKRLPEELPAVVSDLECFKDTAQMVFDIGRYQVYRQVLRDYRAVLPLPCYITENDALVAYHLELQRIGPPVGKSLEGIVRGIRDRLSKTEACAMLKAPAQPERFRVLEESALLALARTIEVQDWPSSSRKTAGLSEGNHKRTHSGRGKRDRRSRGGQEPKRTEPVDASIVPSYLRCTCCFDYVT